MFDFSFCQAFLISSFFCILADLQKVDTFTLAGFSPGLSLYVYDKEVVEVTESVVLETKTQRAESLAPNMGHDDIPSGKRLHNYGKIHHFSWEKSL